MSKPNGSHVLDEAVRAYVHWRNECHAVQDAYVRWGDAGGDEVELAYVGYLAALELEERAAAVYADLLADTLRAAVAETDGDPLAQSASAAAPPTETSNERPLE